MANVLVYIELEEKQARPASLCALNAGRAVATSLGATLYALLPCSAPPSYGNDDIIAVLSRYGADKVILVTGSDLDSVPLYITHGEAVRVACAQFRPRLVLMASTAAGRDIAPRLAMQLGASYLPDVEVAPVSDDFQLTGLTFRRRFRTTESLRASQGCLVATLLTRGEPQKVGDEEAEVVMLQSPAREAGAPKLDRRRRAPDGDPLSARLVVAGGAGLQTEEGFARLRRLASALGAALVASQSATDRKLAPELTAPGCMAADVYMAFGISGSDRHMAALPPWTRIVAVNTDPAAPILKVAEQALIADADQTLKELLAEVEPREEP